MPLSLTGETPQVLGNRETLLLLVPRNYGYFLECLDLLTGVRRWSHDCFLGTKPADLELGALDETAAYFIQSHHLRAHALADGKLLWQRALPQIAGPWRTILTRNYLVTFPHGEPKADYQARWLCWMVHLQITFPQQAQPGRYFPVLIHDAKSGQLVQRLNFPAANAWARVETTFHPLPAVIPEVRGPRVQREEPRAAVQIFKHGMTVVLDGRAWALAATAQD
jgi:hypothetical protein